MEDEQMQATILLSEGERDVIEVRGVTFIIQI